MSMVTIVCSYFKSRRRWGLDLFNLGYCYQFKHLKNVDVNETVNLIIQNMKPVFSYILIGLFFLFIFRSIYSLYTIFQAPTCITGDTCYISFLNEKPDLDLYVYVSDSSKSGNFREVLRSKKFDYSSPFERY